MDNQETTALDKIANISSLTYLQILRLSIVGGY